MRLGSLTLTDHSSIFRVNAVVDSYTVMSAVKQCLLCAIASEVVKMDTTNSGSKEPARYRNSTCTVCHRHSNKMNGRVIMK